MTIRISEIKIESPFEYFTNDRFKILVISTLGEIRLFEKISPRSLVEMTALMRLSVICTLFPIKNWVVAQGDGQTGLSRSLFH